MEDAIRIEAVDQSRSARGKHGLAFAGLFLFTLLLYARPNEAFPDTFGDFPLVKIVAIVTILTYIVSKLISADRITIWPLELKMLVLIAVLGILFISTALAPQESTDLLLDLFLKVVAIFILMVNLIDTRPRLRSMMRLVVVAGAILGLFAIANYIEGNFTVTFQRVGVRIGGVVGGIFGNPNDLATSLNLLLPMAVALALTSRGLARIAYYACAATLGIAVVMTFSRGGFLGLAAMCGVLLWKLGRRHRAFSALALVLTIGVFLAAMPVGYSTRITSILETESDPTGSAQMRRDLLERATAVALAHPLIGVGMANYHIYSLREQKAHNSFLEIAAELGLIGLIAYLIMIFAPLRRLRRIERETLNRHLAFRSTNSTGPPAQQTSVTAPRDLNADETYYLSIGLQASMIAYIVCSSFASIQYLWFVYYPLAYAISLRRIHIAESSPSEPAWEPDRASAGDAQPAGVLWTTKQSGGPRQLKA